MEYQIAWSHEKYNTLEALSLADQKLLFRITKAA